MTINHIHNLPFFDMKIYEKLSYDQLCRQLFKCKDPVTILNIIQDLLEFSDNSIFNNSIVYDRLGFCLNSYSDEVKKKALLVLYRCLIFIEEKNTNELVNSIFNNIISCSFSDSFNLKRISLQCLIIIISDLSVDEFVIYIENACREFLKFENRIQCQKFSMVIRELFAKLPSHLKLEEILWKFENNIQCENDINHIIFEFISRTVSRKYNSMDEKYIKSSTVLHGDIFPKRLSQSSKIKSKQNENKNSLKNESEINLFGEKKKVLSSSPSSSSQLYKILDIYEIPIKSGTNNLKLDDKSSDVNYKRNNLSSKIRGKFPNEFFQTKTKENSIFEESFKQPSKQIWNDDIYRYSSDQPDFENESVPSYYLDSIRKSASKKRDDLSRKNNFAKSAVYNSQSKYNLTPWNNYLNEDGNHKRFESQLPKIKQADNGQLKFISKRTVSYPVLIKNSAKNSNQNQAYKAENLKQDKLKRIQPNIDSIISMLTDKDWNKICDGLLEIQQLMLTNQKDFLDSNQLRSLMSLISDASKSLRSQVSRLAIQTIAQVIQVLGHKLDFEADLISEIIIGKAGEINKFIREDINKTTKNFLIYLTTERSLISLNKLALHHRNGNIRKLFAENLNWLFQENFDVIDSNYKVRIKLIEIAKEMSKDSNEEARFHAKEILRRIPRKWVEDDEI